MRKITALPLLLLLMLLGCDSNTAATSTPTPLAIDQTEAKVVHAFPSNSPILPYFQLSPDGSKLLVYTNKPGNTVLYDLTRNISTTLPLEGSSLDRLSVAFAPDSSAFIYTEDLFIYIQQSDVHLYDIASAKQTNLTGNIINHPVSHNLGELAKNTAWRPGWSPDSQTIYYVANSDGSHNEILSIPRSGGQSKTVFTYPKANEFAISHLSLSRDNKQIIYIYYPSDFQKETDAGIHIVNSDGSGDHQVTKVVLQTPSDGSPMIVLDDVAPQLSGKLLLMAPNNGHYATTTLLEPYTDISAGLTSTLTYLDPLSGRTTTPTPSKSAIRQTYGATWSPDGKRIAFVTDNPVDPSKPHHSLWLYEPVSGKYAMVYSNDEPSHFILNQMQTLTWAGNDTIAVFNGADKIQVLQLGPKSAGAGTTPTTQP
ncbi:MAG: hypothetical protein DLM69_02265 [Candidatus Chloroheliales bacterium]|nr:MAG: hypothetical protein DLM69_02265 [Chloroflexota bacterium]